MAVCSRCQYWVDPGGICDRCGTSEVEVTAFEVPIAPRSTTRPLRPQRRAAVPILLALDDDSDQDGEAQRLRSTETIIGRRDADWTFSNDLDMSGQHAKLVRQTDAEGRTVWRLFDLNSANGTFVRIRNLILGPTEMLMIGGVLAHWEQDSAGLASLRIFEKPGDVRSIRIRGQQSISIGSDPAKSKLVIRHSTVDASHADLRPGCNGWQLDDSSSLNGIWKRVSEFELESGTRFLLGEQRFLFKLSEPNNE